ncbi:MAG: hypothetical protein QOE54_768, partial [Streptosporangiaceae bacterium]|nr:hypothetical protein [Streptosporangiaceae bacterium]
MQAHEVAPEIINFYTTTYDEVTRLSS